MTTTDRLYNLLPAVYRQRDAEAGEPLRALLGAIEAEVRKIEGDIEGLYDDWFIETCAEWVAPYIGDLLWVRPLNPINATGVSARPYVANTLAYRRRKGTVSVIQQLARDVTGFPARAVEFFQLLETTQHFNHVRRLNLRTPDLRDTNALELLGGAFESAAHTADVRSISASRGKYNNPNTGIFLWRLESYPVSRGSARTVTAPPDPDPAWRFSFHPLGIDAPLFNTARPDSPISDSVTEANAPGPLRLRPLYDELEAARSAQAAGDSFERKYFGDAPVLEVFLNNSTTPIDPLRIQICNLEQWRRPSAAGIDVAVDPVLARLAFAAAIQPQTVEVSYNYGFSADLGGGPYNRFDSASRGLSAAATWQIGVSKEIAPVTGQIVATIAEAVAQWNLRPAGSAGIISLLDSRSYDAAGADPIEIPAGSQLMMVGAEWPLVDTPGQIPPQQRLLGQIGAERVRPHLSGPLTVLGTASSSDANRAGSFALDGVLLEGSVHVQAGNLGALRVAHCTVRSGTAITVDSGANPDQRNESLAITLDHTLSSDVTAQTAATITLLDTFVDGSLSAPSAEVRVNRCTIRGAVDVQSIEGSNSIFVSPVRAERRQIGCIRFSFVPDGSRTPRQYRCQPQLTIKDQPAIEIPRIRARLVPSFTSMRYGDPAYGQLALTSPIEIRTGAEDGSEMGVFSSLQYPQREANLRAALEEYLRVGLEAGIFYAS